MYQEILQQKIEDLGNSVIVAMIKDTSSDDPRKGRLFYEFHRRFMPDLIARIKHKRFRVLEDAKDLESELIAEVIISFDTLNITNEEDCVVEIKLWLNAIYNKVLIDYCTNSGLPGPGEVVQFQEQFLAEVLETSANVDDDYLVLFDRFGPEMMDRAKTIIKQLPDNKLAVLMAALRDRCFGKDNRRHFKRDTLNELSKILNVNKATVRKMKTRLYDQIHKFLKEFDEKK